MNAFHRWTLATCLVLIGFTATGAQPLFVALDRPSDPNMVIRVEDEHVSVKLKNIPVKAVVEEIGRQGRIAITIHGDLTSKVSSEFKNLPLEEGLRRLLKGCGWMAVGRKNGRIEQLIVAQTPEGLRAGVSKEASANSKAGGTASGPSSAPGKQVPGEPTKAVAGVMSRKAVQAFFDTGAHKTDTLAMLNAFNDLVDAVNTEEVGQLLAMLQDKQLPAAKWDEAFAPLGDVLSSQELTALVQAVQSGPVRDELVESFTQVYLFKTAQERELRERR